MKKLILILGVFLSINSCKKTESPCAIEERSKYISFAFEKFPPSPPTYHIDSLTIYYKGNQYPFTYTNSRITIQLPQEEGIKDTFFLHWNDIPDTDTMVLYFKTRKGKDHPCESYEYMDAWFNGEFYPDYHGNTFYFTKK